MKQASYNVNIDKDVHEDLNFENFQSVRAKLSYASISTVLNALIFGTTIAKFTEESFQLNKPTVRKLLEKFYIIIFSKLSRSGMKYVQNPRENIEVVVCVDAAFAVSKNKSLQVSVLVMLQNDQNGISNILL